MNLDTFMNALEENKIYFDVGEYQPTRRPLVAKRLTIDLGENEDNGLFLSLGIDFDEEGRAINIDLETD